MKNANNHMLLYFTFHAIEARKKKKDSAKECKKELPFQAIKNPRKKCMLESVAEWTMTHIM